VPRINSRLSFEPIRANGGDWVEKHRCCEPGHADLLYRSDAKARKPTAKSLILNGANCAGRHRVFRYECARCALRGVPAPQRAAPFAVTRSKRYQ
jgi:hypothetical protein